MADPGEHPLPSIDHEEVREPPGPVTNCHYRDRSKRGIDIGPGASVLDQSSNLRICLRLAMFLMLFRLAYFKQLQHYV